MDTPKTKQTNNNNNKPTLKVQGTSQKRGYKDFKSPRIMSALKRNTQVTLCRLSRLYLEICMYIHICM